MTPTYLRRVFQIARLGLASILFVLTIEVAARVDDKIQYDAPLWGGYTADRLRERDSEGLRRNVPGSQFQKWKNNRFGFRGPDFPVDKPPGIQRIVCMGTSETYGLYESPGMEWPAQLREQLAHHPEFEVINAATVGLKLGHYEPYIREYVAKFQPDVFILFVNPFRYASLMVRGTNPPRPSGKSVTNTSASSWVAFPESRSFPKLKQVLKELMPQRIRSFYQTRDTERQVREAEIRRLQGQAARDRVPDESLDELRHDIARLVEYLRRSGAKVVLSSYPSMISQKTIREHYATILDDRKYYVEFSFEGMMDIASRSNDIIRSVANQTRATFVDSAKLLPKNSMCFADNLHYTDEGAKLIAEAMSGVVLCQGTDHQDSDMLQRE